MNWKLELRYGKLKTDYSHRTILADGVVGDLNDGFMCRPGRAWMSMKAWSIDTDQAADMIKVIGRRIGFEVDGKIEIYNTDPDEPPKDKPLAYDIRFYPYDDESAR